MINAKTQLCALIGNPVEHSLSPAIHNAAFQEKKLNYAYLAFQVSNVEQAIQGMRGLGIKGLSVTIPHKVTVMPYLDSLDDVAKGIGAVNTVVVEPDGRLKGYNTDGLGALQALEAAGTPLQDASVVLIGSGGAARAIAFTLATKAPIKKLTICGIEDDQIAQLVREVQACSTITVKGELISEDLLKDLISDAGVVINASPIGMSPKTDATPVPKSFFHSNLTVFDIVYNPLKTKFLQEAEAAGCRIVPGAEMFIQQAVAQFELWTGIDAPVEVMRRVVLDALKEK